MRLLQSRFQFKKEVQKFSHSLIISLYNMNIVYEHENTNTHTHIYIYIYIGGDEIHAVSAAE